jgi:hypothetical protein
MRWAEEKTEREKVLTDAQKARLKELLVGEDKDKKPADDKAKDKPVEIVKPKDKPADK